MLIVKQASVLYESYDLLNVLISEIHTVMGSQNTMMQSQAVNDH